MSESTLNIQSIRAEDAVKVLSAVSGRKVSEEDIREVSASGAPIVNSDGTINLLNYAAWLIKEIGKNGN